MAEGKSKSISKRNAAVLNVLFSFFYISCLTKVKASNLSYLEDRKYGFMPFRRVLARRETQTADSVFSHDNSYTKHASLVVIELHGTSSKERSLARVKLSQISLKAESHPFIFFWGGR